MPASSNLGAAAAVATTNEMPPGSTSSATSGGRFVHVKKSRGKRRGSKESSRPRHSGSVSSQLSVTSPLNEEPELNEVTGETATGSATTATGAPPPVAKVKSADTNVRVSLKIVNEIENVKTNVVNPAASLDIVEEELAKMAVAESLNDIPNSSAAETTVMALTASEDATRIEEIDALDEDDVDEDSTDDDDIAGEEGDDEDDLEEDEVNEVDQDAVVVNLPISAMAKQQSVAAAALGPPCSELSEPGTPLSQKSSDRSSHNSASSAGSTKLLLPKEEGPTTPVQHESKIVMVASKDDDEDVDDNEDFC